MKTFKQSKIFFIELLGNTKAKYAPPYEENYEFQLYKYINK